MNEDLSYLNKEVKICKKYLRNLYKQQKTNSEKIDSSADVLHNLHNQLIKYIGISKSMLEQIKENEKREHEKEMEELRQKHERTKLWIKVIGTAVTVVGGAVTTFLTVYFSS